MCKIKQNILSNKTNIFTSIKSQTEVKLRAGNTDSQLL